MEKRKSNNNPLTNSQNLQPLTQDNFFRKSGKGFNSMSRSENYGIIKSDLFQLQEMINENSYCAKMYKITSKSPSFSKRLTEIEENKDIKLLIEKVSEDASNTERTGKLYNTTSTTELIQKLSLDLFYNELFLKKLSEYFLLLHLKVIGEENLYQETYSKIFVIKLVIDKLLDKSYSNNSNNLEGSYNAPKYDLESSNITGINLKNIDTSNKINSKEIQNDITTEDNILQITTLNEFLNNYKDSENLKMKHLAGIISNFLDKINSNYTELIQSHSNSKYNKSNNIPQLEHFITQKLLIEKIISEKDKEISKMSQNYNNSSISNERSSFLEEEVKRLQLSIKKLEEECLELKNNKVDNTSQPSDNKTLLKIIEENNKTINRMKSLEDNSKSLLYEEIKELTAKCSDLDSKYCLVFDENNELRKQIEFLSKNKKNMDFDSYEQLLQEQFNTMKNSFLQKIENLNDEMNQLKIDYRKKTNILREDLDQTTYVKDLFLRQITELQKRFGQ